MPVAKGLSNILWAYARLEAAAPDLAAAAGREVPARIAELKPRDMAELVWAFAKMQHTSSPGAVEAMARRMVGVFAARGARPDAVLQGVMALTAFP